MLDMQHLVQLQCEPLEYLAAHYLPAGRFGGCVEGQKPELAKKLTILHALHPATFIREFA